MEVDETRALPTLPSLVARLDRPLVVVDVRCRWGFEEKWKALGPLVDLIGFDADAAECEALSRQSGGGVRYVAAALGASPGPARLFVTREPACNSLYPPDPGLIAERPELECTSLVSTVEVELTTLDGWAAETGVRSIDVLKLDAQGAELLGSVRALEVEVELNPLYQGQPLFGDVDRFLREHDFVLWRLGHLVHYGLPDGLSDIAIEDRQVFDSQAVELVGRGGQVFWAHACYVRREMALGPSGSSAVRDACIAKVLGFDDLATHLFRNAGER